MKHVGEIHYNSQGCKMIIVDGGNKRGYCTVKIYGGSEDFICERAYHNVKNGEVDNLKLVNRYGRKHIGEKHQIIGGYIAKVIDGGTKKGFCKIQVSGGAEIYISEVQYVKLANGNVKNPFHQNIYGKGYIGVGNFKSTNNNVTSQEYKTWFQMLRRCYSKKYKDKFKSYKKIEVCEEWLNFQNFAKWYQENYREFKDERIELDKDLLSDKNNKIYSPSTCVFIPRKLNVFLIRCNSNNYIGNRGIYLKNNKFVVEVGDVLNGGTVYLGTFNTLKEATMAYDIEKSKQADIIKKMCVIRWDIKDKRILDAIE